MVVVNGSDTFPEPTEFTAVIVTLYSVNICNLDTIRVYCITAGYISVGTLYTEKCDESSSTQRDVVTGY